MKKHYFTLFTLAFVLAIHGSAQAIKQIDELPFETAILKFSDQSEANWKEISRKFCKNEGMIEKIPLNQTTENWTDLIRTTHYASINKKVQSIENVLQVIKRGLLRSYEKNTVTWNIIEKTKDEALYEWKYINPDKKVPQEHEIGRIILTDSAFHNIAFVKKHKPMTSEEREAWIQMLKENVTLMTFQKS